MVADEQLVRAMATGDQAAFEAFVHRYHGPVLGYLERMLRDSGKAEDIVQETFIRLIKQLQTGVIPEQIKPWMYRVATNLCRDYWRSAGYRHGMQTGELTADHTDPGSSVIELYERQETRREMVAMLAELPDSQREIVLLRFFQDLKLQEIADALDMSLSAVKTSLYNGLRKIKKKLDSKSQRTVKEENRYARS